nr:lipid-A-disaccharide synthase N-terminal domain-containing protein [Prevotella sp.]
MFSAWYVYAIGFLAQFFFSARILIQWLKSEKSHRVVSPNLFWIFSLTGSIFFFMYGYMRHDFSIILGQLLSYYIYIWNLRVKGVWKRLNIIFTLLISFLPIVTVLFMLSDAEAFVDKFLCNELVPTGLLLLGTLGQIIFTLRFVYQYFYSHKRHESIMPIGFWIISIIGASMIVVYGIIRLDPVLILGQSFGFMAYIRNIVIYKNSKE